MDWISYVQGTFEKEDHSLQAILSEDPSDIPAIRQLWLNYSSAVLEKVTSDGLAPVYLAKYLYQIAIALRHSFPDISPVALEGSVVLSKEAIRHTPQDDDDRAAVLNGVMTSLMCRYEARKDVEDLLTAFRGSKELMEATSMKNPQPGIWTNLGHMAFEMFQARGGHAASEAEIELLCRILWSKAKSISVEDFIEGLSSVIHNQDFGCLDCLDLAAWCTQMALELTPSGADNRMSLRNLRSAVSERYRHGRRKGDLEDLQVAISISTVLIKQALNEEQLISDYEHLIGHLNDRFIATRKEEDLNAAIEKCNEGMLTAPPGYPRSAVLYLHHAKLLRQKYQFSRDAIHLNQSLSMAQDALLLPSHDRVEIARSGSWLHVLSVGLSLRFQQTHDPEDMDRAIEAASKAVKAAEMRSTERDYEHATIVCSLAALLMQRYEMSHAIDDINSAALLLRQLRRRSPENHQDRDYFMSNLVMVLGLRHHRLGSLVDIDEAIEILRTLAGQKPRDRYFLQARLCTCLYRKYLHTREHRYFRECFEEVESISNSLPLGNPDSALALGELSLVYKEEAYGGGDKQRRKIGLIRWLELAEQAIESGNEDLHIEQMFQHNLGLALLAHFHETGRGIERAIHTLRIASGTESFGLLQRIECALDTARALSSLPDWQQVYSVLDTAIRLLPLVSSQTRVQDDQQFILGRLSNLASMGCSAAIEAGKTSIRALELLEGARGAICSLIIDAKSDISHLGVIEPDLYRRYLQLQKETAQPSSISATKELDYTTPVITSSRSVETAINSLREVVDQIRAVNGFERFQLPPSPDELKDLARDGPLVSFAVSEFRSDAILVTKSEIKTLSLPGLSLAGLKKHKLGIILRGNEARRDVKVLPEKLPSWSTPGSGAPDTADVPSYQTSLLWLWKVAIRPVLDSLNLLHTGTFPRKTLPHILWVGGGLMSLMPLHAAGDHSASSTENTISHVISSYASTFKALRYVKDKPWSLGGDGKIKLLAVAMPKTAGHADLNVAAEVSSIEQCVKALPNAEVVHARGKAEMIDKLKAPNILHCACHGCSDPYNPLDGGLLLGDTHQDRLTLRDLKSLSNDLAQIAYLSACSTAELRDQSLVEESIHMASMFQLIGFRHVIGTMWGAYDDDTVHIASAFYQLLLDPNLIADKDLDNGRIVAFALHHAVMRLRKDRPEPEHWAPFVHFGP